MLRNIEDLENCAIGATDGAIGHVKDFYFDDETWADSRVSVKVARQAVRDAPPQDPTELLDRQHEMRLYKHYGRPGYWADAEILETDIVRI